MFIYPELMILIEKTVQVKQHPGLLVLKWLCEYAITVDTDQYLNHGSKPHQIYSELHETCAAGGSSGFSFYSFSASFSDSWDTNPAPRH